jgi:hypothetical protein
MEELSSTFGKQPKQRGHIFHGVIIRHKPYASRIENVILLILLGYPSLDSLMRTYQYKSNSLVWTARLNLFALSLIYRKSTTSHHPRKKSDIREHHNMETRSKSHVSVAKRWLEKFVWIMEMTIPSSWHLNRQNVLFSRSCRKRMFVPLRSKGGLFGRESIQYISQLVWI